MIFKTFSFLLFIKKINFEISNKGHRREIEAVRNMLVRRNQLFHKRLAVELILRMFQLAHWLQVWEIKNIL